MTKLAKEYLPFLWAAMLAAAPDCWAQSQLGCLERSMGKSLNWNARWASDQQDNNVEYQVVGVTPFNRLPERSVTLELKAVHKASISARTVKADSEESARRICERIFEKRVIVDPFSRPQIERDFIHYTKDGWVRGYPPTNKPLTECSIGSVVFSCTEDDKSRYGNSLKAVQEQVRWLEE